MNRPLLHGLWSHKELNTTWMSQFHRFHELCKTFPVVSWFFLLLNGNKLFLARPLCCFGLEVIWRRLWSLLPIKALIQLTEEMWWIKSSAFERIWRCSEPMSMQTFSGTLIKSKLGTEGIWQYEFHHALKSNCKLRPVFVWFAQVT